MRTQTYSLTVIGCTVLMAGALLACKKNKEEEPTPVATEVVAPAPPPEPKADPNKVHAVGDVGESETYKLTLLKVEECKPWIYDKAKLKKEGKVIVGAEILLEATSDKPVIASSYNAKLTDGEGLTYNSYMYHKACGEHFSSANLNQGEKKKGWITFGVPEAAKDLKLTFENGYPKQMVKFDLGR
jgi:hypothetical protein